jgi:serine/threonine protein kinase
MSSKSGINVSVSNKLAYLKGLYKHRHETHERPYLLIMYDICISREITSINKIKIDNNSHVGIYYTINAHGAKHVYKIFLDNSQCEIIMTDEINKCDAVANYIVKYNNKLEIDECVIFEYDFYEFISIPNFYKKFIIPSDLRQILIKLILITISILHENNIFHLDLNCNNINIIFCEDEYKIILIDFGLSRILNDLDNIKYDRRCLIPTHARDYYTIHMDQSIYLRMYNNIQNYLNDTISSIQIGDILPYH